MFCFPYVFVSALLAYAVVVASTASPGPTVERRLDIVCLEIQSAISSASVVNWPGSTLYTKDISHWASSSTELAECAVEPGTAEDVGIILQILAAHQKPFAVKGGGHSANPGFSSTRGVQIAMFRFSEVTYDSSAGTVAIGSGLIWDDVYTALAPHEVNVVGGRVTGVGVAGFTLGGGYSWLSNQYGLTIDTVVSFELVLPNGTVTEMTGTSNPDLFFALKGGFNNFGIVTKFVLQAFPQGDVWGGLITYTANNLPALHQAVANFSANNIDPKAGIITTYNFLLGEPGASHIMFYDGPTPPSGIFDSFLAIPALSTDVSTRSFISLVQSSPSNDTAGFRGEFNTISLKSYSVSLLEQMVNQSMVIGLESTFLGSFFISYDVEPFLSPFTHSEGGAHPHTASNPLLPLNMYFAWTLPSTDSFFHDALATSAQVLYNQAIAEGQDIAGDKQIVYGNYATYDTPLEKIYGATNLARLKTIKAQYDPENVMGLAGGFKF